MGGRRGSVRPSKDSDDNSGGDRRSKEGVVGGTPGRSRRPSVSCMPLLPDIGPPTARTGTMKDVLENFKHAAHERSLHGGARSLEEERAAEERALRTAKESGSAGGGPGGLPAQLSTSYPVAYPVALPVLQSKSARRVGAPSQQAASILAAAGLGPGGGPGGARSSQEHDDSTTQPPHEPRPPQDDARRGGPSPRVIKASGKGGKKGKAPVRRCDGKPTFGDGDEGHPAFDAVVPF